MRTIQFSPPDIREEDIESVAEVLRSGWITTGTKTLEFEKKLADYIGTDRVVCCSSCTIGMEMILRVLGIGPGDEVIVPAYTYTASASVINHVGAKIVFCDTAKDSFWIDYDHLSSLITERTKAVIIVDLAGGICDYERIYQVIEDKQFLFRPRNGIQSAFGRIAVIADSAHALGARCIFRGKWSKAGNIADFSAFSFHAVKNLTTAEGGAITWKSCSAIDNDEMTSKFNHLILHGQSKTAFSKIRDNNWEYDVLYPAYKGNMTDIMAALGLSQMKRFDEILSRRRFIIESYQEGFDLSKISYNESYNEHMISSGHLFLMRVKDYSETERNNMINELVKSGISVNVHYKPLPMMTAYKNMGFDISDYPNAFCQYRNEITLPVHMMISNDDINYIIQTVNKIVD